MKKFTERHIPEVAHLLVKGGIGVIKTDTLYGIVASATDENAVERVYAVRKRDSHKPVILLIADHTQVFDGPQGKLATFAGEHWPGAVSIIIPSPSAPLYLTRGGNTLAYRVPADTELRRLLYLTGPLIAPSANLQGEPPARTIDQAEAYFGDAVDFYVDSGEVGDVSPSQLWHFHNEAMQQLR